MIINDVQLNADLNEIVSELQSQLALNHIMLLQKTKDLPDDIMVQCPYHGNGLERRPSAGISKSTGKFHCFACNEIHELPEVISYCFGHYEDAFGTFGWKWLNKNFTSVSIEERDDIDLDMSRDRRHANLKFVSEEELDSYRYTHPYWKKRKITNEDIIELFDLGYDKHTDCITFPVRDIHGNCLFVARRSTKTKYFNYPKGVEKPLYGLYEIHQLEQFPDELIVCESMLDALTAWEYGKYAVALNGLGNERQFKELRELPCRKIILATDNDSAGMTARDRIRNNVPNKIITEYILPENRKDLNELSLQEFQDLKEIF